MQVDAIQKTYRRWAPIYDLAFGRITQGGRVLAARHVNALGGSVLEVGIGTGLALGYYGLQPGVWSAPSVAATEVAPALIPGVAYELACWRRGDTIEGPFGTTDLWYRLPSGGYVTDAYLYTGTNRAIPGVRRC